MRKTEIRIKETARGKRAYRYEWYQARWFPISMKEAERRLAAGEAFLSEPEPKKAPEPIYCDERGRTLDLFDFFPCVGNA